MLKNYDERIESDVSYKLFMIIIGNKIDAHQLDNHEKLDIHAGFTTGGII